MRASSHIVLPVIGNAAKLQDLRPTQLISQVCASVDAAYAEGYAGGVSDANLTKLFKRATRAYSRRFGSDAIQPEFERVTQTPHGPYITLSCASGSLAIYSVQAGRLVFFMTGTVSPV